MKFKVTNIDWCVDEDTELQNTLPTEVEVEVDGEEDIADYLSDRYGWLVNSFAVANDIDEEQTKCCSPTTDDLQKIQKIKEVISLNDEDLIYSIANQYTLDGTIRCIYEEVVEAVELAVEKKNLEFALKVCALLYELKDMDADEETIYKIAKLVEKHLISQKK